MRILVGSDLINKNNNKDTKPNNKPKEDKDTNCPKMAMAVKGLMKGIRYITSIFEQEREPEMQIGGPTDVKHVAHIGWDGPTASAPSWMDTFKGEGGDVTTSSPQGNRSLPDTSQPPSRPHTKGAKRDGAGAGSTDSPKRRGQNADGSEPQAAKPSRKKKQKGSTSSSGSSKASAKGKGATGRLSQTDLGGV